MSDPNPQLSEAWSRDDTEKWLTDWPLPGDFTFHGEIAWPRYRAKFGYGQWLRTAGPYHVALRGLFLLIHEILAQIPVGHAMPTTDQLVAKIREIESSQTELPFSSEDLADANPPGLAAAAARRGNDSESDMVTHNKPTANPT